MPPFVDRVDELQFLQDSVESTSERAKVILVSGDRGIGKSAVTRRFLEVYNRVPGIKIPILASGDDQRLDSGALIRSIANSVNRLATERYELKTLKTFLYELPSRELRSRYNEILVREAGSLPVVSYLKPLLPIFQRITHRGFFDPHRLLTAGNEEVTYILFEYLGFVLSQSRLVVNVENIQVADSESLEMLRRLAETTPGTCYILEYTLAESSRAKLASLVDYFQGSSVEVTVRELKVLPFEAFLSLINEHPQHVRSILEKSYYEHRGNLRSLIDLEVHLDLEAHTSLPQTGPLALRQSFSLPENPTLTNIETLAEPEKLTLAAIVTHQSQVPRPLLRLLLQNHRFQGLLFDQDGALKTLQLRELIRSEGGALVVSHDQVAKSVADSALMEKAKLLCYAGWADLYQKFLDESDFDFVSRRSVLLRLFNLYSRLRPQSLLGLLGDVHDIAESSLTPDAAAECLAQLRSAFSAIKEPSDVRQHLAFSLLDIHYDTGQYGPAMQILAELPSKNARAVVYRAALLDRMDRHQEAIALIEDTLRNAPSVPTLRFILGLILMISYRSLGNRERAFDIFKELVHGPEYVGLREFPWLLRNAEMVVGVEESLSYLQQSVQEFHERGETVQEGMARLSLAMQLARLGRLSRANEELGEAEDLLVTRPLERHVFLNNRGVTKLLSGQKDANVRADFSSALTSALPSFDRLVILYNALATASLEEDFETARVVARDLLELVRSSKQLDPTLRRSVYYNLSQAFKLFGDSEQAGSYLQAAVGATSSHDSYWRHRLYGERHPGNDWSFMAKWAFHFGFLSRWHFTPPSSLARLELP